jgi:hypothetical protein
MAAVVSGSLIQVSDLIEIYETELTEAQLGAFVNMAHYVIQAHLLDKGLGTEMLTQIHLNLAAHYASLRDQRLKQMRLEGITEVYQGETGQGLKSTHYGQTAVELDSSGSLASLGDELAGFYVATTPAHGT